MDIQYGYASRAVKMASPQVMTLVLLAFLLLASPPPSFADTPGGRWLTGLHFELHDADLAILSRKDDLKQAARTVLTHVERLQRGGAPHAEPATPPAATRQRVTAYSTRDPPGWIVVGIAPTCRVEVQTLPGRKLASVDVTTWQRTPVPPALAATRSTLPPTSPGAPPADESAADESAADAAAAASYISDADLLYALAPLLSDALGSTIGSTRGRIQRRGQSLPGNLAEHARGGGKRVRFSVTSPYQEIHIVEGVTVSANLTREAGSGEEEETRREQEDLEDSLSRTLYMDGVQQSSVEDEYVCV